MHKEDSAIPVEELIRRYNREIMEFQKRRAAVPTMAAAQQNRLDTEYPEPHIEADLQKLREEQSTTKNRPMTQAEIDEQEPGEMETPPAVSEEPAQAPQPQQTPMQPQQERTPEPITPAEPVRGVPAFPINPTDEETQPAPPERDMSLGYLRVTVSTGRGELPVRGARVTVSRMVDGQEILEQTQVTNESGMTSLFTLPAVSSTYSQSPGNLSPYTYYTIYVHANGYNTVELKDVPLYGGATALQQVDMIPTPEGNTGGYEETIVEGAPQNLQ